MDVSISSTWRDREFLDINKITKKVMDNVNEILGEREEGTFGWILGKICLLGIKYELRELRMNVLEG